MKKLILSILGLLILSVALKAQNYVPGYLQNPNQFINDNFTLLDQSGWFIAKENSDISPTDFVLNYKQHFGMGANDNFVLLKSKTDNYPFTTEDNRHVHDRYVQTHNGYVVESSKLFVHHKDGRVKAVACKVVENITASTTANFTELQAFTSALNHLGANNVYAWDDVDRENELKDLLNDPYATYYPDGELIFAKINANGNYSKDDFVFAWKFDIYCSSPDFYRQVYIDAHTGLVINDIDQRCHNGPALLSYNYGSVSNSVTIDTKYRSAPYWHWMLFSDEDGRKIRTKYWRNGPTGFNLWGNITTGNDQWGYSYEDATTPHWCISKSWEYFKVRWGRNGCKGNGRNVQVWACNRDGWSKTDPPNQTYYQLLPGADRISVGYRDPANKLEYCSSIDAMGHEYAHGFVCHETNIGTTNEPGALNESFGDIFGFMIERYIQGGSINDWLLGEDYLAGGIRNMENPLLSIHVKGVLDNNNQPIVGQPTVYNGPRWYTGGGDLGGVHHNCGVQNYWFYLLSQGSGGAVPGTVNSITVQGLGVPTAERITYYNVDNQLAKNDEYLDARAGAIATALLLYGACSNEYEQTWNAWAAVGIGNPITTPVITGPSAIWHYGPTGPILGGSPDYVASGGTPGENYSWSWPMSWTAGISGSRNNKLTINNFNTDYNAQAVQVNSGCRSNAKIVNFSNLISYNPNGNNGGGGTLAAFPNPVSPGGQLNLEVNLDDGTNAPYVVVFSTLNGSPLYNQSSSEIPTSIPIGDWSSGEYILTIQKGTELIPMNIVIN